MDRAELLVTCHRLRRAQPRNQDVLALTDYVLGGGEKIEVDGKWEAEARSLQMLLFEKDSELGTLRAKVAELQEMQILKPSAYPVKEGQKRRRVEAELDALKAEIANAGDKCLACKDKAAELKQVRELLRLQNKLNDERYNELEKLKSEAVLAATGECPECERRRAQTLARVQRVRERRRVAK